MKKYMYRPSCFKLVRNPSPVRMEPEPSKGGDATDGSQGPPQNLSEFLDYFVK